VGVLSFGVEGLGRQLRRRAVFVGRSAGGIYWECDRLMELKMGIEDDMVLSVGVGRCKGGIGLHS
jgi:hypothetical protein